MAVASTSSRIVDAALSAFGTRGFEATSLDSLAATLGVRKQTILYHFASKDALLDAVIDEAGAELIAVLEEAISGSGEGWARIDAVVRSVFRLAGRRPCPPLAAGDLLDRDRRGHRGRSAPGPWHRAQRPFAGAPAGGTARLSAFCSAARRGARRLGEAGDGRPISSLARIVPS